MANTYRDPCSQSLIESKAAVAACPRADAPWILLATILGSSMVFIDTTVVNLMLPVLQVEMGADVTELQWIVQSYALSLTALLLIGGVLGDRYGRRRIFALGVVVFALASALCGIAQEVEQLIVARALQGVGGALLVPGSLAIIGASFGESERGRAIGTWSAATAVTMAVGPVLGGWLTDNLSWRWVFLFNLPAAVVVLAILYWRVPESRDEDSHGLDWLGGVLAVIAMGGITYGLTETSSRGLDDYIVVAAIVVGLVAGALFLIRESRARAPLVPMALFESRAFTGANLITLLLYAALAGALFFLPFNMVDVHGYSVTAAGAALLPFILSMSLLSRWSGALADRIGPRWPLMIGPTVASVGFLLFTLPGTSGNYWQTFFPAFVVLGLGMAISVAPLTTTVMGSVASRHVGVASGVNNTVARGAALLALAVFGFVFVELKASALNAELEQLALPGALHEAVLAEARGLGGMNLPEELSLHNTTLIERAADEAFVYAFRRVMVVAAVLSLVAAWLAAARIKSAPLDRA